MRQAIRLIIKYLYYGVSWGCTIFVAICLLGFFIRGEAFLESVIRDFPRQAAGYILMGIAYGSTPVIYRLERLTLKKQLLLHFLVATGIAYPVSLSLDWTFLDAGQLLNQIINLLIYSGTFMLIWCCFYLVNCYEAKKINLRLKDLEKQTVDFDRANRGL